MAISPPFGMLMPERSVGSANYRYLFNGMEVDNEVSGNGNSYTTEFRQYDPRLGRWKSLDPLMYQFPWMSPYVAFDNNPVYFVDPLGLEGTKPTDADKEKGTWTSDGGNNYTYDKELDSWYMEEATVSGELKKGPTPLEGAYLSKDSYNSQSNTDLPGGWKESENIPKNIKLRKDSEGFKSRLYERERSNGMIEYAYVFAGTDGEVNAGSKDWSNNGHQIFGNSRQYKRAIKNAKKLNKFLDSDLTFVGHSLGGGLATAAAGVTGRKGITFNSAWLSYETRKKYGIDNNLNNVDSYTILFEFLTWTQVNMNYNMISNVSKLNFLYDFSTDE